MKIFLCLAFALFLVPGVMRGDAASPADAPDNQIDYNQIIANFFAQVKAGKFNDAAHVLVDTNAQDAFNVEKHEAIAVPMQRINDNFGAFKEFKPLVSKTLGDSIGYVYGVGIYDTSLVRFEFMFFKDGNRWRMFHIDFSVNFAEELREMAGVHFPPAPVAVAPPAPAPATAAPAPTPVKPAAPSVPTTPTPATAPTPTPNP